MPVRLRGHFAPVLFALAAACAAGAEVPFVHPGLLHSHDDLARIRAAVAAKQEPVFSGYEKLRAHHASQANYALRGPAAEIGRNPSVNHPEFDADANAAYQCALLWCITGERAFAEKSAAIVDAWSASLRRITGADAVLMAGLGPFKLVNAAELLRHTAAAWPAARAAETGRMLREVVYPVLGDFAPFANGNWDTAAIKTVLAIAVFCDDRAMFERALRYHVAGAGNGRLTHYIFNDPGQCQESGRDMGHTQLGLAHLGDACEIAWHQGLDLYGYADNRLLRGFEYTARYNLGEPVPFIETVDRTGKYHHQTISTRGRGSLRPVYEQIFNHYVHRAGVSAPWTQRAAEKLRPEGESRPGADHPGFGTLLFSRPAALPPRSTPRELAAPAGVIARGEPREIALTWVPVIGATHYTVKRRAASHREFTVVARDLTAADFVDRDVQPSQLYEYAVIATDAANESAASLPAPANAGLPPDWTQQTLPARGATHFDGETFTLEAAGRGDRGHFVHTPLIGDGGLVARFVPQASSQFSRFGLMWRASTAPDTALTALLLTPRRGPNTERPTWHAALLTRPTPTPTPAPTPAETTLPLGPALVSWGRLLQPCWLKLERRDDTLTAAFSADGSDWTIVGAAVVSLPREAQVGLFANSGFDALTTTVMFDSVRLIPGQDQTSRK